MPDDPIFALIARAREAQRKCDELVDCPGEREAIEFLQSAGSACLPPGRLQGKARLR